MPRKLRTTHLDFLSANPPAGHYGTVKRMRLAFLGVSHWHAGMHADAAKAAGAEAIAAWDPSPSAAAGFAQKHGCAAVASMDDALSLNPDMAVIMGRPAEIAARGLQAIATDTPLLLEKPIGISAGAVDPLIEAAERAGAFVAVALPHTLGMLALVRELDRAGRLGPISHTHFRLLNGPPRRYVDDGVGWVLDPAIGGGGALRNLGIHGVHAFLTLAGNQPVTVEHAALGRPIHGTAVEDYAAVVLRAADAMIGVIEAGYTYASMTGGSFEWRVSARNATLTDEGDTIRMATLDDGAVRDASVRPPARRYDDSMSDMLKRLTAGQGPAVSLADCRRAMDVIDRCYAAQGEER